MTTAQNNEFTLRVASNVARVMDKGVTAEAAKKSVFEELNANYPMALAAWLKHNAAC